ncbi:MAG: hypothetical protein B0W54_01685 [Cellvibrio sp. 79]|nr:MAG: hypothetical protein B0W54_01685 [Cellvibrio sp. 79]
MISKSKNNGRSTFIADNIEAETIRKQFIEAPLNAARQSSIHLGLDLLDFMSALPDAFIAAEERELKRLSRTSKDKNDLRIEQLKLSIERTRLIRDNANVGKSRIDRALVALSEEGNIFHGFVSDTNANPRAGLTVRITVARENESGTSRSAITDDDGYFSISLGSDKTSSTKRNNLNRQKMSGKLADLFATQNNATSTNNTTGTPNTNAEAVTNEGNDVLAEVTIFNERELVYQDEVPLIISEGTAYREYVVDIKSSDAQRYVGNVLTRELHDTQKLTKNCQFDEIKTYQRVPFASTDEAEANGFDYCAYCFGKEKSRR